MDGLGPAPPVAGVVQLVVGTVPLWRVGLAAAVGGTAGVVLLREASRTQVTQAYYGLLCALDAPDDVGFACHGASILHEDACRLKTTVLGYYGIDEKESL